MIPAAETVVLAGIPYGSIRRLRIGSGTAAPWSPAARSEPIKIRLKTNGWGMEATSGIEPEYSVLQTDA
jgi:hypothetical protein